ncbi:MULTISPECIES: type II toxin-antitoxin system HigB family toxin [unclassified Symbiopectobacterium]|uniref:type II toxin-antitoxin system HigB family toxin n=1 Tax=unclassified Symbiopectobacterium TaxID=2794573 RepID=UPI0022269B07|nr:MULTISPECIES: type II toxin-antitoxin system HigB family toxin [unclassified Symbiopectobacterium]MCW2475363.1 type II toxin-antitoxin system HigB family toxin [Candidatus Symbiopectobacterium sp. NZEC151]MCW2482405.1 type II toxin-antitoxin system HigB family toxin [Candidatus Symbiopectobacterium sp. NZEC135]
MRLIGKQRLQVLSGINHETDVWLSAWTAELTNAYWKDVRAVLDTFPRAQQVDQVCCIFFVCGIKSLGIKVTFKFDRSIAVINQVVSK